MSRVLWTISPSQSFDNNIRSSKHQLREADELREEGVYENVIEILQLVRKQAMKGNSKPTLGTDAPFLDTENVSSANSTYDMKLLNFGEMVESSPWELNMTGLSELRLLLRRYFNVVKRVSVTQANMKPWQLVKFDSSPRTVFAVNSILYGLLPKESPFVNLHYSTCAVVGSSGILLGSSCGQEIDSADFVFRCNMATRSGFQDDVGFKTDFMTINPGIVKDRFNLLQSVQDRSNFLRALKELGNATLWSPTFTHFGSSIPLRVLADFLLEYQDKVNVKLALLGEGAIKYIKGFWKVLYNFTEQRITTGLFMYTFAVPICDEIRLYGFYPFQYDASNKTIPWHYYDPTSMTHWTKIVHKMPEEYAILRILHSRGLLKLKTGKCR
ncbi:alpha-N-acetylneuraminate alpha-2,8-sialyltransferase ST8SIA3-like [Glandiceps talaboti]